MTIEQPNHSILILHGGALGDCALTLHFACILGKSWNCSAITMAARSALGRWAHRCGLISGAHSLDEFGVHRLYNPDNPVPHDLQRFLRRFDRIISFLGGPLEAISRSLSVLEDVEVLTIDPRPSDAMLRDSVHITQQWAAQLAEYGHPVPVEEVVSIQLSESYRAGCTGRLARRLGGADSRIVLCHPGSGGLDKCSPLEGLERLARSLKATGWCVGWMIGPDEVERFGDGYIRRLGTSAPVVREDSVDKAADLVCGAQVYIGHDAGMTHVAALAGVRTLAIFGPTDPRVWRPLGRDCRVVGFPAANQVNEWTDDLRRRVGPP
jgi:hypothetical protein